MTPLRNHIRQALTVYVPLLIGGLIYVLYRADNLLMFRWFDVIGLRQEITTCRQFIGHSYLPAWIIFSLPDALWVFSFSNFMLIIWRDKISTHSIFWVCIAPIFALISEIGQSLHFVHGTFDPMDFTLILIGSILPFVLNFRKLKTQTR